MTTRSSGPPADAGSRIESQGIDTVPEAQRSYGPRHIFWVLFASDLAFSVIVTGSLPILFGLGWWSTASAIVVGSFVGALVLAPMGLFGPRTGTNNAVSSGAHFGVAGRMVGTALALFSALGFVAITIWTGGDALVSGAHRLFGTPDSDAVRAAGYALIAAVVVLIATWGFHLLVRVQQRVMAPGGHLGRDADGRLDGSVWDAAADLLTGPDGVKIGNHGPNFHLRDALDVQVGQLQLAQELLLAAGVTSVVDAQVTSRELRAYLALRREGGLTMRVEMLVLSSLLGQLEQLGLGGRLGDDRFAFAGLKLYVDGALTAGTAHFSKPYCCDPRDHGYQYHEVAEITDLIRRAHALGLQTGTHAQGDAAIGIALDALEAAMAAAPRHDARHRIEHCGFPAPEHVERIARLGVHPVTQPQYVHRFGDELSDALGERAHRLTPLGEFAAAGVPVVLSSDAPVCPPKPLEAVYAAVARRTLSGAVLGGEAQRIDVMTALRGHTLGAAASIHREATIGSLEPGKYADFVLLSDDPTRVAVEQLPQIAVRGTWIDGARVSDGVAPTEVVRSLR